MPDSSLPGPLRLFLRVQVLLAAACGLCELFCHSVLHLTARVYTSPLFVGWSFFDFECYHTRFGYLHTARFFQITGGDPWPFTYPAPLAVVYALFLSFRPAPLDLFLATMALLLLLGALLTGRALCRQGLPARTAAVLVTLALATSYPLWFAFQRANMELVVFAVAAAGLALLLRGHSNASAVLLGLAGAMKLYPLLLLALLVSSRRYRAAALGVAVAVAANLAALRFIGPTFSAAVEGLSRGVELFHTVFLLGARPAEFGYDHFLYGFVRRFFTLPAPPTLAHALTAYLWIAAASGALLYWFRIRRMPLLNQVLLLVVSMVLLPPVSFDYTLIELYLPLVPLALFSVALARRGIRAAAVPGLRPILLCLALLTGFESELILGGVRLGSQAKCLVLVCLFALALRYPLALAPSADDPAPEPAAG